MADVLARIVADKRDEIATMKQTLPLAHFREQLTPSTKSMEAALRQPGSRFILECKKASPSKGLIREPFDLDEIIAAYAPFADAISVLTDEKYFQGRFEYLAYVTSRVSQPVLNKDFFVEPYQVWLARHYGADAILLMLSVLSDEEYRSMAAVAEPLGLDILTEVSNEEEMHRAIALGARIIGINNRDLRDLSTDLATTERLVPLLKNATHQPVVISESGIFTHNDVQRLAPWCHGFLVGSALMAQPDLTSAVKQLVVGNVKICGITSQETAQHAWHYGASYLGLIFAPMSKRVVSEALAKEIVTQTPARYVGVFVNQDIAEIAHIARTLALTAVQLHGDEDAHYRQQLREALPSSCELWQAVGITHELPSQLNDLLCDTTVSKVVLDTKIGGQSGGTGQRFNWHLITQHPALHRMVLAGGIDDHNVAAAKHTGVATVDVNSGIEQTPGVKPLARIQQFFNACRAASGAHLQQQEPA